MTCCVRANYCSHAMRLKKSVRVSPKINYQTINDMNSFEIVRTVRLTEKGTRQGDKYNQYTIVADPRANKTQIRQAVQELFKVKVARVNTLNVRGKARRQRTKQAGTTSDWKKAIVTLKAGDKIVLT